MERVDVAIVGGGPAGASAAEQAAAHGAETVLFEQGVPREDREELGPDSTDAAGMLDYWIDIMGFDYREIPDDVILQELEATEFIGPNSAVELRTTGIDASYPKFGYTFNRARMDDWLYDRATEAGADLRVGVGVKSLETDLRATSPQGPTHTLSLSNGDELEAQYVVLADGPQRRITLEALDQLPHRAEASPITSRRRRRTISRTKSTGSSLRSCSRSLRTPLRSGGDTCRAKLPIRGSSRTTAQSPVLG